MEVKPSEKTKWGVFWFVVWLWDTLVNCKWYQIEQEKADMLCVNIMGWWIKWYWLFDMEGCIGEKKGLMKMMRLRSFCIDNRVHCAILLPFSWREEKDGPCGISVIISYTKMLRSQQQVVAKKNQFFVSSSSSTTISPNTSSTMCMISILISYHTLCGLLLLSTRSQRENQWNTNSPPLLFLFDTISHLLIDTITTPINL